MNLLVSYNWLCEYLPGLKASPEEVAEKLSRHAFSVERLKRMDEGLDVKIVVGRIEKIEEHPKADKLRVVIVQGTRNKEQGTEIVCGGTNLYEGQLVAVALPGAKVRWHGEGEPVELKPTEIRGVKSEGMICAANEIGLENMVTTPDPSSGRRGNPSSKGGESKVGPEILDLTWTDAKVGIPVAQALGLDDTVLEVEVTSNRPDAMGVVGLAREVGAIFNVKCKIENVKFKIGHNAPRPPLTLRGGGLNVKVEVPKLCPRYIAVVMEGVKVGPSPWWMQQRLIASGVRPINSIVDITNYVLLEWGQPCHAFDFDKIEGKSEIRNPKSDLSAEALAKEETNPKYKILNSKQIVVRLAKVGEEMLALDGNTYALDENILVIADARRPIAIAGIMGGEETGVGASTTRIIYEIANFDSVTVRRGEHQLGLSSESSVRFSKGLPVQLPEYAAARLIELTKEVAGGEVVAFKDSPSFRKGLSLKPMRVAVSSQEVMKKIGVEITAAQMKGYLTRLGFDIKETRSPGRRRPSLPIWRITFPWWRFLEADGTADIAEEVARLYGYHKLPGVLPEGNLSQELPNEQFNHEQSIKEALRGAGFTELYTYSFVSREEVERAGFDPSVDALPLANPLTSELTHLRPWLGISALKAIAQNEKQRENLHVFELTSEYHPRMNRHPERLPAQAGSEEPALSLSKGSRDSRDGRDSSASPQNDSTLAQLPEERQKLIVASAGKEVKNGEHFYAAKGAAEHLAQVLSLPEFGYEKIGTTSAPWVKLYHPARVLLVKSGRDILGVVGELHPRLLRAYGIEHRVAFLEWELKALLPLINSGRAYVPPLPYPPVKRDIAFVVALTTPYAKLHAAIAEIDPLVHHVELFDQYEGKGVPDGYRSLAFHISYASPERTLKAEEADKVHEKLSKMLKERFSAKIRD